MTIKTWLEMATQDADRRGLPELKPLLEALAGATSALRTADWNDDASGESMSAPVEGRVTPPANER
jgi:hypothetical protein